MIGLLGASGYTGRLVARALDRRDVEFLAAGRDPAKIRHATGGLEAVAGVRAVDVTAAGAVEDLCDDADVVVSTVGPYVRLGRPVLRAALAAGCHYLDCAAEQPFLRWAYGTDGEARRAEVTAIPAAAMIGVPGDLLAALAAAELDQPREVHVAYLIGARGIFTSRGTRRTAAELLNRDAFAYVDGRYVRERPAEARRLAWFPRPVGPRHAVGYPGSEALMIPRHLAGVRTVRSYLALPAVLGEVMQAMGSLARFAAVRRLARRLLTAGPAGPSPALRAATRWGCVAEAADESGRVARAWAYGRDIYGLTAEILAAAAERLDDGRDHPRGTLAPAQVLDPAGFLDELASVSDLRWSA